MDNSKEIKLLEDHHWSLVTAEADLAWTMFGISEVIDKVMGLKEKLEKQGVDGIHFDNLQTFLAMHHYLMEGRHDLIKDEMQSAQMAVDIAKAKAGEK
ncbi:hypothetical protein [Acinetobacter higginsii]|uniref:hypothetical protein n=1 Tax=Acinetobacter higginsii TaxID=70347 RepID=UPI001F4B925E|nr:hypothetical protein [Acinetobacter higginsii]MCH7380655.1 hypothetical protein [Acinetobacter higginsii]